MKATPPGAADLFPSLRGGRLWVESEPGQGSTFMFTLPRTQPASPRADADSLLHGQLVLIVEDNEKNLRLARDLLQYHGFRTLEAQDADTGLRMAKVSLPNTILMDIELPGMDGVTALEQLRADPATAGITVVAVTASVMPVDRERFARAGFAGVIVKPIDVKAFPNQVRSYCNRLQEGG